MTPHLRVVCLGGGLGAPTVMAGLRAHTDDITGIIAVTDSGRSTGKVRIALDVPAPGDIRNAIEVLAEGDPVLRRLFGHRFETDKSAELNGMAFGNLFLAALAQQEGSFLRAVEEAARLLGVRGKVLPVTLYNTHLCAKLADGTVVEEEVNVRALDKAPIERIFLRDPDVKAARGTCAGPRKVRQTAGALEQAGHHPARSRAALSRAHGAPRRAAAAPAGDPMTSVATRVRHFLSIADLSPAETAALLDDADALKRDPVPRDAPLHGRAVAVISEKPSLRTRRSLDVAMRDLGGHRSSLSPQEGGLGPPQ